MNRGRKHQRDFDSESPPRRPTPAPKVKPTRLRIVAGALGGRKIDYNGDPATRPMKERTRESVFSLLGGYLYGKFAIDLFGGTGILAFESVSRGAERAIILEMARPAVTTMLGSLEQLGLSEVIEVHNVDTLRWFRNLELMIPTWPQLPWVVFCCPPFRMWENDQQRLCQGLVEMYAASPVGSQFVCETEQSFDVPAAMPQIEWDVRKYSPAKIAVCTK
jgi:16S rRNA (guanine966-N2)-methyltransferase